MDKKIHDKNLEKKVKERIAGKIDVQLGKSGITDGFVNELKARLNKHGVVKIRVLKSFRRSFTSDIDSLASILAEKTESRVYEIRGFTIILIKEK
ncbi:MAG: YhbY family RNA-binding protein [Desulfurococcaceae archaeon]